MESLLISSGKISQDPAHCSFFTQFRKIWEENASHPINSVIESLEKRGNEDTCALTSRAIRDDVSKFKDGHWAFLGPGEENKWYYDFGSMPEGKWDLRASRMVNDFENLGHPVFKGISPLDRWILKKKKGKDTIHFNGEYSNVDPWYRAVHSANQLFIHGAVTK